MIKIYITKDDGEFCGEIVGGSSEGTIHFPGRRRPGKDRIRMACGPALNEEVVVVDRTK
jgi:hypothetical protein